MKISLVFKNNASGKITVNNSDYEFKDTKFFDFQIKQTGFFLLKFLSRNECVIKDILVENDSVRELIYLGYAELKDKKIQPYTNIKPNEEWCFPLILPLSNFLNFIKTNIRNGYFGQDIFKIFKIYMPESIKIKNFFPTVLRNYFEQDNSFSIIEPKGNNVKWFTNECELPFQPCSMSYPNNELSTEFLKNLSDIDWDLSPSPQQAVNKEEYNVTDTQTWKKFQILKNNNGHWTESSNLDFSKWPVLYDFLKSIPNENIFSALFMELPPGGFIYPHNDSSQEKWGYSEGVECLYIPLSGDEKNIYFKFGNYGCVDLTKINFINNTKYPHAVVNQSKSTRFVLSLKLKSEYIKWKSCL